MMDSVEFGVLHHGGGPITVDTSGHAFTTREAAEADECDQGCPPGYEHVIVHREVNPWKTPTVEQLAEVRELLERIEELERQVTDSHLDTRNAERRWREAERERDDLREKAGRVATAEQQMLVLTEQRDRLQAVLLEYGGDEKVAIALDPVRWSDWLDNRPQMPFPKET